MLILISFEVSRRGQSLIAHSGLFDKAVHSGLVTRTEDENAHLNSLFSHGLLKKFIDENPDYLLMLSSDHGMSRRGSSFHGDQHTGKHGNIGFFVFYNPLLSPKPQREIDVVDLTPTIAKFLTGEIRVFFLLFV